MKLTLQVGVVLLLLAALVFASLLRYEETVETPHQPLIVRTDRWTGQQSTWDAATGKQVELSAYLEQQRNAKEGARQAARQALLEAERQERATEEAQSAHERRGRALRAALSTSSQPDR